jgi:hypothetical protein
MVEAKENVLTYGDREGDKFYIILAGMVSAQIPNPAIAEWILKRKNYISLKHWRETKFQEKIERNRELKFEIWKQ